MDIHAIFAPIEADLEKVEARLYQAAHAKFGPLAEVIDATIASGGKRIRPALVLLSGRFHPAKDEALLKLATSVEMLHVATLIHDDLLDRAATRRGAPTISARWNEKATVLAGDFMMAKAAKISAEVENFEVMSIFADTIVVICEGEIRQDFDGHNPSPKRQDYYDHIYAKTASLFAACTRAAAVLTQAPDAERKALHDYGYNLGMAFQIVDDVLDFSGEQREVGKPLGSDLRQGLATLPTIYFYEQDPRRAALHPILARNGHAAAELDQVIEWIRASPAIEASRVEARTFAERATHALESLPPHPCRDSLQQLAEFVVERTK